MKRYETSKFLCLHADLYRLENTQEVDVLDLDRLADRRKIIIIEWANLVASRRNPNLEIHLKHEDFGRSVKVEQKK